MVSFESAAVTAGDRIYLNQGTSYFEYRLTAADVLAGKATITPGFQVSDVTTAALIDQAGNISKFRACPQQGTTEDFSNTTDKKVYTTGQTLVLDTMSVKVLQGKTLIATYGNTYPEFGHGKRLYFGYSGTPGDRLEISFDAASKVSFTTDYLHRPATYEFYDIYGNHLATQGFDGIPQGYAVSYTANPGVLIGSVVAYTTEWGFLDNFEFSRAGIPTLVDDAQTKYVNQANFSYQGDARDEIFVVSEIAAISTSSVHGNGGIDTLRLNTTGKVLDMKALGDGDWVQKAVLVIDGVNYNTYQHSSLDVEVLVKKELTVAVTNPKAVGTGISIAGDTDIAATGPVLAQAGEDLFAQDSALTSSAVPVIPGGIALHTQGLGADPLELHHVNDVTSNLIELSKQRIIVVTSQRYVDRMAELVKMLEGIVAVDSGRVSELTQARARLLQAEASRSLADSKARDIEINLRRMVGERTLPTLPGSQYWEMRMPELSWLLGESIHHPTVLQAKASARSADMQADAVRSALRPQVNWVVSKNTGEDIYGRESAWQTGLTLSWSAFRGGSGRAAEQAARQRAQAGWMGAEQQVQDLEYRIRAANQDARSLADRADLYRGLALEPESVV